MNHDANDRNTRRTAPRQVAPASRPDAFPQLYIATSSNGLGTEPGTVTGRRVNLDGTESGPTRTLPYIVYVPDQDQEL